MTDSPMSPPRMRPARPDEAESLTALVLRSKAWWGYDAAFMDACCEELTLHPDHLGDTHVAEADGRILGMYRLAALDATRMDLDMLFVDPPAMGRGVGRLLWCDAVGRAFAGGHTTLEIAADPDAQAFYRRMGARDIGTVPSGSIPGRLLPLMTYQRA